MLEVKTPFPKTLIINQNEIKKKKKIGTVLQLPDKVVVLLATHSFQFGDPMVGRNLLAYDAGGNLVWRIEDHGAVIRARPEDKVTKPDENGVRWIPQSVLEVEISEKTGLVEATLPHWILEIDPETGKILDARYNR